MATPLETIKQGIINNDITMVLDGYNRITGEMLAIPNPQRQRQQPDYYDDAQDRRQQSQDTEIKQKIAARAEPFIPKKRINLFADESNDTLPDYSESDRLADIAAKTKKPAPRREPYVPVSINCGSCGKRFNVNPIFVTNGEYSCDRCSNRRR